MKKRWGLSFCAGIAVFGSACLWYATAQTTSTSTQSEYEDLVANYQQYTEGWLGDWFLSEHEFYLQIFPPGTNTYLLQPGYPEPLPFDPEGFPKKFMKGLVEEWKDGVPVYPIGIALDAVSHEIVFFSDEQEIYSIKLPEGYDPYWLLHRLYGEGVTDMELLSEYSPSRVEIRAVLIDVQNLAQLLYNQAAIAEAAQLEAAAMGSESTSSYFPGSLGEGLLLSMGGSQEVEFVDFQWPDLAGTNGFALGVGYPESSSGGVWEVYYYDLPGPTGVTYSGIDNIYTFAFSNLVLTGATRTVWIDTNAPVDIVTTNPTQVAQAARFYALGNARVDSDDDSLSDGSESFVYKTNPDEWDTDTDGMNDGWEVRFGFDPLFNTNALADPDGDGVNNLIESLQGRNPNAGAIADTNGAVSLLIFTPLESWN